MQTANVATFPPVRHFATVVRLTPPTPPAALRLLSVERDGPAGGVRQRWAPATLSPRLRDAAPSAA